MMIGTNLQRQSNMKLRKPHKSISIEDWGTINWGDEEMREIKRSGSSRGYVEEDVRKRKSL